MNFKEFIELADQKTSLMDKEELQIFIHSIARKVYEGNREDFIKFLEEARIGDQADGQLAAGKIEEQEIEDEFNRLKGLLDQVEEGELYLQAEGYEDNSSGYWNTEQQLFPLLIGKPHGKQSKDQYSKEPLRTNQAHTHIHTPCGRQQIKKGDSRNQYACGINKNRHFLLFRPFSMFLPEFSL